MRGLRLKPLYIKDDDIFVAPPEFLTTPRTRKQDESCVISDIDQLREMLRGRRLKKNLILPQRADDEEQVKNLPAFNQLKPSSPVSPLVKKFSFLKNGTFKEEPFNSKAFALGLVKVPGSSTANPETAATVLKKLLNKEKTLKAGLESEASKITQANKQYEFSQLDKYNKVLREIESTAGQANSAKDQIEGISAELENTREDREKQVTSLNQQESSAFHRLLEIRRKNSPPGAEDRAFMERERIRTEKQNLISRYLKTESKLESRHKRAVLTLEDFKQHRINLKSQLKQLRANLFLFYCSTLRAGLDLREDGARWAIKALWAMGVSVPVSSLPKFLDEDSAHYLFSIAQKELELNDFRVKLEQLLGRVQEYRSQSTQRRTPQDLLNSVKTRLKELSKSVVAAPLSGATHRKQLSAQPAAPKDNELHRELSCVRENIERVQSFIQDCSYTEVKRVVSEHSHCAADLEHTLNCLLGKDYKKFMTTPQQ